MSSPSLTAASPSTSQRTAPRPRCSHVARTGTPCRYLAVSAEQPFCKHHLPDGSPEQFIDLLNRMAENFDTPEGVTNVLYSIFFWCARGHISERRAGVLTYVAQTILNSQRTNLQLQKLVATAKRQGFDVDNPYDDAESGAQSTSATRPDKLTWNLPPTSRAPSPPPPISPSADPSPTVAPAPCSGRSLDRPSADVSSSSSPETPPPDSSVSSVSSGPSACSGRSLDRPSAAVSSSSSPETPPPDSSAAPSSTGPSSHRPAPEKPAPPLDLNHFFPRDPSLPRHLQDPDRLAPPFPSQPELDRRNALFDRRHGFRRRSTPRLDPDAEDWMIIHGRR